MASQSGDQAEWLAGGLDSGPMRENSAPEITADAILVGAARAGDRTAFGRLYDRYSRMVHGVLLAKVPVSEVDDLVQDVFVLALRRLSTLREAGSFGAWLAAIARNLANDYHRRSVPEDPLPDDDSAGEFELASSSSGDRGSADRSSADQGSAAAILDTIRSLPDAYRETLILRLVEGMTGPEIAARTGLTHGSVRVNLYRGMEQLRAKLSPSSSRDGREKASRGRDCAGSDRPKDEQPQQEKS